MNNMTVSVIEIYLSHLEDIIYVNNLFSNNLMRSIYHANSEKIIRKKSHFF